ncbi:hypothetical protein BDY17DRAFT_314776 [Neohortaea acidophila]|uniref:Prephenate dehydratase domain-containing protein n=1 Tax=Neohortaea acidophila TaxID=245834 RepID=A0A6A6Q9C8_9PEZI|nr:uncharacterized protein BDY17DRAFT_314776 [Neohortaea acidophila]KAF2487997.1 hypothetical protein BDY17DRAFT_314776 [Neohortaea acidophila]
MPAVTFDGQPPRKAGTADLSQLAGKSVIVTGGASGLGEAMVRAFSAAGAFVTIGDIAEERALKLVAELGGEGRVQFVRCNVTVWKDQVQLFKAAMERSPAHCIDVVVGNAGVITQETFEDVANPGDLDPPEPDFTTIHTTLMGNLFTAKLAIHYFQLQPEGPGRDRCLILTASISGYVDHATLPQYSISKWGIRGFMRATRRTLVGKKIRINVLAPWYTRTNILPGQIWDALESQNTPLAKASDVALAAIHLAADPTINGRSFAVLPRELNPDGYVDLGEDDYAEGSSIEVLQRKVLGA